MDEQPITRVEHEADLIRQEHRLCHVAGNFLNRRRYPTDDPRYQAAGDALIWRIVFSPSIVGVGVGLVSVFGLWLALQANALIGHQNSLIEKQAVESADTERIEKMRYSVFQIVNMSTEWYRQLHQMTSWSDDVVTTFDTTRTTFDTEKTSFDGLVHNPAMSLYVENRDVVPEFKLHVLILKQHYPECSSIVEEAENVLVLLTDYDREHPGKRIICSSMYDIPDWERSLLPKLDSHIQALALRSAVVLGP